MRDGVQHEFERRRNAPAGQNEPGTQGAHALPNAPAAHALKPVSDRKANMGRIHNNKSKQPGDSDAGAGTIHNNKSKQPGDSDAGATEKHTHTNESK